MAGYHVEHIKQTRAGRVVRVGSGSPQGIVTQQRGVLYFDIGANTFKAKRNAHLGPLITLGSGSPQGVRKESPGTFYLDVAPNTIGAPHRLYVATDASGNWTSLFAKKYINFNGTKWGWVLTSGTGH